MSNTFFSGERKGRVTFTFGGGGSPSQTQEFSIPSSLDRGPDGRVNTNFLELYELGYTLRDWALAKPSDRVKPYLEADISLQYVTSSPTVTGAGAQDALHSELDVTCYDYSRNQLDYHRLGLVSEMRAGARLDLNPYVSAEGQVGFATDTVAFDRGFFPTMAEISVHLAGDDLLSQRRRALEFFARADGKHYWNGNSALTISAGVRSCVGPFVFDVTASRIEAVNDDLYKGLDQVDGNTLTRVELGGAIAF